MGNTAEMKQGDSFAFNWVWTPAETGPANLLGTDISASIRIKWDTLPLAVTVAEDGLSFSTVYEGDSSTWAPGTWPFDIKFVFPSGTSHSVTFRLIVAESITL